MTLATIDIDIDRCGDHACADCYPTQDPCSDPECWGCAWKSALAEMKNQPVTYYLNEYQVDLAYGGPEEGGWTYETGIFTKCLGTADSREKALRMRRSEQQRIDEENARRPDFTSVLSQGELRLYVQAHRGEDFPKERPYYC